MNKSTMHITLLGTGLLLAGILFLQSCAAPQPAPDLLAPTEAQMKIRSLQTRTFDLTDRKAATRASSPPCRTWVSSSSEPMKDLVL